MLSDTHPDAEKVQIELLRKASVAERAARLWSLNRMAIRLARRAIARAHPDFNRDELNLKFVELHYGKELAEAIGERLREG